MTGVNQSTYLIDYNTVEDIAGTDKDILKKVNVDAGALMRSSTPTADQMSELIANTTQTEVEVKGVKGIRFYCSQWQQHLYALHRLPQWNCQGR